MHPMDHPSPDTERTHLLFELHSLADSLDRHEAAVQAAFDRRAEVTARLRELGVTWSACATAARTTIPSLIQTVKRRGSSRPG